MKRIIDKAYGTYSTYVSVMSQIYVKCPKCNGLGIVTADNYTAFFKCTNCGSAVTKERTIYRYDVHNQCKNCGRYYRVDILEEEKQHFPMLYVACPFCGYVMEGKVHKTAQKFTYRYGIENACEPFFGLELWFLTYFKEMPIWAINREHLTYLIDYLSADLREKPAGYKQTQADQLPKFMKTAKNRKRIVKLLYALLLGD